MRRRVMSAAFVAVLIASAGIASRPVASAGSCAALASLKLPDTVILSAAEVSEPSFAPPGAAPIQGLPVFCRVTARTAPAINFDVWLPVVEQWNGKFQGVGNGGMAGVVNYTALAAALRRGYAAASTDTGHVSKGSFDASWALGRPELIADFGHRGLHLMTVNAQKITAAFYGKRPRQSYYVGCSKGGQQGLMEAQRYPDDYDGIIAGDPANNWTRFYAGGHLWYWLATTKDPASYIPAEKIPLLNDTVNAACDSLDGVRDGVLEDPRACKFDPAALTCRSGQDPSTCFTPPQVRAVQDIWRGAHTSSGELVYPGLVPGGEAGRGGWAAWTTGTGPSTGTHVLAADGFFKNMVFDDPAWDFRQFNYDRDVSVAVKKVGPLLDAVDTDLGRLRRRGARLLVYHGWSDPDISPLNTIAYYEDVVAGIQGKRSREEGLRSTAEFFRLFMVPGMQHCGDGPGTSTFDMLTALEAWVEKGEAPERIPASHQLGGGAVRTRPLCLYPAVAVYTGTGSTDDAANFTCRAPSASSVPQ